MRTTLLLILAFFVLTASLIIVLNIFIPSIAVSDPVLAFIFLILALTIYIVSAFIIIRVATKVLR